MSVTIRFGWMLDSCTKTCRGSTLFLSFGSRLHTISRSRSCTKRDKMYKGEIAKVVCPSVVKLRISNTLPSTRTCSTCSPSLNEVMIVDQIMDKSVDEIAQIWKMFHESKDCVSAIIPVDVYVELQAKASMCPLFLYPLPRKKGYEFFYSQFSDHRFYFTTLSNYQLHHENSPICLTLTHYTDLQESKGIVLMKGELDLTVINPVDAQFLANQVQLYYNNHFALVKQLNHHPSHFDYNILLNILDKIGMNNSSN